MIQEHIKERTLLERFRYNARGENIGHRKIKVLMEICGKKKSQNRYKKINIKQAQLRKINLKKNLVKNKSTKMVLKTNLLLNKLTKN